MRGLIEFLTSDDKAACTLREKYRIIVVPMLNPDGVIVGNYRCSLSGYDMNRQWQHPDHKLAAPVHHLKRIMNHSEVVLFCDLHGHSRMLEACMYGNKVMLDEDDHILRPHLLPFLMSTISDTFSFERCTFKMGKNKEGTGRAVAYREYSVLDSFTLECSLAGTSTHHLDIASLER